MMVRVGFWHPPEVKPAASITNRLLTSWACWYWFRTEVFASLPIRATPISWIPYPGIRSWTCQGLTFFAPAHVDLQGRDAERVHHVPVDLHAVLVARQHLAEAREAEARDRLAQPLLEGQAEAGGAEVEAGGSPALEAVAAKELGVLGLVVAVPEPDHVDPVGPPRPVEAGGAVEIGEVALRAARHPEVVHQVVAEGAARVREAVRLPLVCGVQEDAGRLQGLGGDHERARHGREGRVEVGLGDAAALAGAAVVTGLAAVDGLGQVRGPAQGDRAPQLLLDLVLEPPLRAVHAHRGMELAVGQLVDALWHPGDADVVLDQLVVGDEVLVGEGPVLAEAVEGGGLHVEGGK